jgi:DNA polymerase III gamma/tau subunit
MGLYLIAQVANGSPRSAISLLDSIASIGATEENVRIALSRAPKQISINILKAIVNQNKADVYRVLDAARTEGRDLTSIVEECARTLINDITRCSLLGEKTKDQDIIELIGLMKSNGFKGKHIIDISRKLLEINLKVRQNVPPELMIPVGILEIIDKLDK